MGFFDPLKYEIAFHAPRRLSDIAAWHLHIPFAFAMTAMLKPERIVELGTHKGDSYCAFCQAVDELRLDAVCRAVDTWQGDEHSGYYGEAVLQELRAYHDPLYGGFSSLMQSRFDDALPHFPEGSIDLLHIDGHHAYDSVRHDFESWLPRMSRRGVVLFHDSSVREREFGVWRLWSELAGRYPGFEFKFGSGLGVLAVGGHIDDEVKAFLDYAKGHESEVSGFFLHLGTRNVLELRAAGLDGQVRRLEAALADRDRELQKAAERLRISDAAIREKALQLEEMRNLAAGKDRQSEKDGSLIREQMRLLDEIYGSKGWRWLTRFRRLKALITGPAGRNSR